MVDGNTPTNESTESDQRHHSPSLQAEIHLLASSKLGRQAESLIPSQITVQGYTSVSTFLEDLSGKVAVVILDVRVDGDIRDIVTRTIRESEHARVTLLATDGVQLLGLDIPYDEAFVFPEETDAFESEIRSLYIRSYYAATIERYYKICFSMQNRKTKLDDPESDEQLQRLQGARERLASHLRMFRRVLSEDDMDAIANREHRLKSLSRNAKNNPPPDAIGLPNACPNCGLD
ncbi:hypothetical protein [Halovenus salina]|uniref:HalX domain-containing protein n=1 Tax=Halovenus salina TaxID=1510225 RepID=A0ABD5W707_9EURY|nr:hypothetical protein [Halovenus salina]